MTQVQQWRIHIGAHKTATTHFQDTLRHRREELAEQGLDYLPLGDVRKLRLPPSAGKLDWRLRLSWPMRHRIENAIEPLRSGSSKVAFSEENLIGYVRDLLSEPFYPDAGRLLKPFNTLASGAKLHIFLSVRRPDQVLASAYVQELRFRSLPEGFKPIKDRAINNPPKWSELIGRIRKAVPDAQFSVWTFEDYIEAETEIFSHFCGFDLPEGSSRPNPPATRSPSASAVRRFEELAPGLSREERVEATDQIVEAQEGTDRYRPFSDSEKALFSEAYQEDLASIQNLLFVPDRCASDGHASNA